MEERTLTMTMLLDFYGDLLTEKQRRYFDLYHNEDLSLSEIAELEGISRQGVWDLIRRAETSLTEVEEKTGLLRRVTELHTGLAELEQGLAALEAMTVGEVREQVDRLLKRVRCLSDPPNQ